VKHTLGVARAVTLASARRVRAPVVRLLHTSAPALIVWTFVTASTPATRRQPTVQQTFQERVNVPSLVIDAGVIDKSGDAVSDVTQDDFDGEIDGKPTRIDSLE